MALHARRILIAALLALATLSATGGSAAADTLQTRPGGAFTATASRLTLSNSLATVACSATLVGTMARSTAIGRTLTSVGTVTGLTFSSCTTGFTVTVLNLPWTIAYTSTQLDGTGGVTGHLFTILNAQINARSTLGISCLHAGSLPFSETIDANFQSTALTLLANALAGNCGTATARGIFSRAIVWLFDLSPSMGFAPAALDFSLAPATPQVLTATNVSGGRAVDLLSFALTGANPGSFAFDYVGIPGPDQCLPPRRIGTGTSCRVRVRYTAGGAGPDAASLDLNINSWFFPTASATLTR